MSRSYPKIPQSVIDQLSAIHPSGGDNEPIYYPCSLTLKSGERLDCVYLCEAQSWYYHWGVWPENDSGKHSVDVLDIETLEPSAFAMPAHFANQLYAAGESGMGYTIFTVVFSGGTSAAYGTGNAVDFIAYPPGKNAADIVQVIPHIGRERKDILSCPEYSWCLYSI
ncbi:hypothetical protein PQU92_02110 [Asticcacaulis sp. BYS171W]|uniref:Uncharacterized protein n=1 Tax=Asticcacaulis aquaticus TaxID=2984212 RepID=A0ABT5HPS2_9CAUL|nr:hypothetical protein [Asticcacaulis aquaticus]MDC7682049.1 hypothetical protein [Asticcacaulis aquaticus]